MQLVLYPYKVDKINWEVTWLVLQYVNPCRVILYESQFNNYDLQLCTVQKCIFKHLKQLNTSYLVVISVF